MNLEERLRQRIQREGPISFYEWMKAALYDKREGFYCADRVRQGRTGDYRTASETSPLFAATFASYFAKLFDELGSPRQFTIVEIGAGSGEFAHGALSTLQSEYPRVFSATHYLIEEISAASRERCAGRLNEFGNHVIVRSPIVSGSNGALADAQASDTVTGVIFSNELIDAFPVNRVAMRDGRLHQLYVGLNVREFIWVEGELEKTVADYCARIGLTLREGQIAEINLDAESFISRAPVLIEHGYVITVDYGAERSDLLNLSGRHEGTLRAFRRHRLGENILSNPGEQDLTTTVDWTQIKEAGERVSLRNIRFERLDDFLIAEGLLDRLEMLAKSTSDMAEAVRLTASARELILPTGMASSFQVLVQEKAARNQV